MALKFDASTCAAQSRASACFSAPAPIPHARTCNSVAPFLFLSRSRPRAVARSSTIRCVAEASETVVERSGNSEASTSSSGPPTADTWELDFSSRPLLDERGKKKWELLICDPARTWEYSAYFPNNKINSTQVGKITALQPRCSECLSQVSQLKLERGRTFRNFQTLR